jgi:transcriptional regulator with XRE-family HTH domain
MAQTSALIDTLKQALKNHRLTYAEVARRLDMSEANVKRMFASKRFTLERLEDVCRLMQMELTDLFQLYEESRQRITQLTEEQEKELVSDIQLLLVAVSVRNHLSFDEMITNYNIPETECIRCLAKLDKLKIIDLLPGNRIKLRIAEDFRWLPNGPIERFFEKQIQSQFLKSGFNKELEQRRFLFGLLSDTSTQTMLNKMHALAKEFTELHRQDAKLPLEKRNNIGFLLAMRPWELEVFQPLRQNHKSSYGKPKH